MCVDGACAPPPQQHNNPIRHCDPSSLGIRTTPIARLTCCAHRRALAMAVVSTPTGFASWPRGLLFHVLDAPARWRSPSRLGVSRRALLWCARCFFFECLFPRGLSSTRFTSEIKAFCALCTKPESSSVRLLLLVVGCWSLIVGSSYHLA